MSVGSGGWSRTEFLGRIALAGGAALAGWRPGAHATAKEPPPETTTLRLRYWNPACWAPFYMAEPLLRLEGFTDIRYVSGPGPEVPELFKKGLVDLAPEFSVLGMYNAETHGTPMKFLSGLLLGGYALNGSVRGPSVSDLKCKTVWAGSVPHNGPHLFLAAIVAFVGLDPQKDISYVWVGKDEAINQFRQGKIDALISFPPGPHELMDLGVGPGPAGHDRRQALVPVLLLHDQRAQRLRQGQASRHQARPARHPQGDRPRRRPPGGND